MAVTHRANARHYPWGAGCSGWHLLDAPDLSVIEESVPPGAGETPHRHRRARQVFYVLAGAVTVVVGDVPHILGAGDALSVEPGATHELRNHGPVTARFLVISAPHAHGDREPATA